MPTGQLRATREVREVGVQGRLQLGLPRPLGLHRFAQRAQGGRTGLPVQHEETGVLVAEMLVEAALGHAGLAHHVGHGGGGQAFLAKTLEEELANGLNKEPFDADR